MAYISLAHTHANTLERHDGEQLSSVTSKVKNKTKNKRGLGWCLIYFWACGIPSKHKLTFDFLEIVLHAHRHKHCR